jgi:superfamily II DNA/RNA helicase
MSPPPSGSPRRARRDRNRRAPQASRPPAIDPIDPCSTREGPPRARNAFDSFGLDQRVVDTLSRQGVTVPFPIQAATLPDALAGRDILGRGATGSGKTLAFALPVVTTVRALGPRSPHRPRAIVLVPTRELATQVTATIAPLASALGLRSATLIGGVGQGPQVTAMRNGVDVIVACPGRLEDLIGQGHCSLADVRVTVLDEADHLADLGFLPAIRRILDRIPRDGQHLLFSATLDNGVDRLVRDYLRDPAEHSVDPVVASVPTMAHHVLAVQLSDKAAVVRTLASGEGRTLLFMRTKHGAKKLALQLNKAGIPSVDLHGNLSQRVRERNLHAFATGTTRVLVATDIAARGIHVDDVGLVVHVDPPTEHKAYVHRSGRTARAGAHGTVVTLTTPEQERHMRDLSRQAGIRVTRTSVTPAHPLLHELRDHGRGIPAARASSNPATNQPKGTAHGEPQTLQTAPREGAARARRKQTRTQARTRRSRDARIG